MPQSPCRPTSAVCAGCRWARNAQQHGSLIATREPHRAGVEPTTYRSVQQRSSWLGSALWCRVRGCRAVVRYQAHPCGPQSVHSHDLLICWVITGVVLCVCLPAPQGTVPEHVGLWRRPAAAGLAGRGAGEQGGHLEGQVAAAPSQLFITAAASRLLLAAACAERQAGLLHVLSAERGGAGRW